MLYTTARQWGQRSIGIVLPKQLASMLMITPGTQFEVDVKDGNMVLKPVKDKNSKK